MNKKVEKKEIKTDSNKVESGKVSSFKKKKKIKKNITSGIAYVYSTFNNTIISIADESETSFHGPLQELKVLKAQENQLLMQHK